ncbi:MAG: electron transfer flavoprotein subunit beta/FixA family protein [Candidatus Aureabacteria bacterium]|nr:electron transfer flavoprotein subunit beta/FixA family protein [Candidatus Auribacterota bacterium]
MSYKIIVLIKQVPDTQNITGNAMKDDGTVNRAALPAIFNPDDLYALEAALRIKDEHKDTRIHVITMGPPAAGKVLKESLYRGADFTVLISDRKFAAADTLATSYALKCAISKIGAFDLVFCGRQAIDGDTAQVGPQIAEKLGINQITFVSKIEHLSKKEITARRSIEGGYEIVKAPLPVLLTFTNEHYTPRPSSAKKLMTYKNANFTTEESEYDESYIENKNLIKSVQTLLWDINAIRANPSQCGLEGSPTKVKKAESVLLKSTSIKLVENNEKAISAMIRELEADHTIG